MRWPLRLAILGTATLSFTSWRLGQLLISDLLFLAAAGVIGAKMLTGHDRDLAPPAQRRGSLLILVGALLLLVAGTLSSLRSWTPSESMGVVLRFGWITLVWFWIMRTVCRDRDDVRLILRAWKFSVLATAVAAILGLMGVAFVSTHLGDRQVGFNGHPNHLAGQIAAAFMLFLLAIPRAEGRSRRSARILWFAGIAITATGLFASGSLSGLLAVSTAIGVAGIVYLTTSGRRRSRRPRSPLAPVVALVVIAGGAMLLFTSNLPVVARLTQFQEGDVYVTASVDSRGERNSYVTERLDSYLVTGLGFHLSARAKGYIDPSDPAQRDFGVHNMLLGIVYQAGLPGAVGVLIVLVTAGRQLKGLLRSSDDDLYSMTVALIGCFVAVLVTSLSQPVGFDRFFWMPVAMTGCLWGVRRSELQEAARPRAERTLAGVEANGQLAPAFGGGR